MKTVQWFMLCMVVLFTIPTAYAQETIDENNNTTAIEEGQQTNMICISVDKLFDTVKAYQKAEYIEINEFMMGLAKMMAPREEKEFLKKIKTMRIIDLKDCSEADKAHFGEYISSVELTSFEPGVNECNDENEDDKMRIFFKQKGDTIIDMIVGAWGNEDWNLIQLTGKMSLSDIEAVANGAGSSVK